MPDCLKARFYLYNYKPSKKNHFCEQFTYVNNCLMTFNGEKNPQEQVRQILKGSVRRNNRSPHEACHNKSSPRRYINTCSDQISTKRRFDLNFRGSESQKDRTGIWQTRNDMHTLMGPST